MSCLLSIHQVIVLSIFHSDYKTNEHELHFIVIILIIHSLYSTILSYRCFIGVNPEWTSAAKEDSCGECKGAEDNQSACRLRAERIGQIRNILSMFHV